MDDAVDPPTLPWWAVYEHAARLPIPWWLVHDIDWNTELTILDHLEG